MKPTNQTMYGIIPLLMLVFMLQSCNIYHSPSYSLDTAIEKEKKIKIVSTDLQTYEFEYIKKEGEDLIGYAKTKSKTAELLQEDLISVSEDGKMSSFKIDRSKVQDLKVKNGTASTGAKVGGGLLIAGVAVVGLIIAMWAGVFS